MSRQSVLPSIAAMLAVLAGTGLSRAADDKPPPSAAAGVALAQTLCASCHLVGPATPGTAQVGPPSFAAIANKSGQTAEHIRSILIQPHAPMPDMSLTNDEMLNLLAYFESLRLDKKGPPLVPGGAGARPDYPEPT